jgi:DNA-binding MarR family transcriptional regulator
MPKRLPMDPIAEAKRQWGERGWSEASTGMTAVTSVIRAQQLMMSRVDAALKPYGLSFARFELLRLLAFSRGGRLPLSSVIARLQVHPASVTSTVDRLTRDGLVSRERHPDDGRAAMLLLTDAGRALVEDATIAINGVFADLGMPEDDEVQLVRILARFRRDAGDFSEPTAPPAPLL